MPRTTHTHHSIEDTSVKRPLEVCNTNVLTHASTRLGVLRKCLYNIQNAKGKLVYKTLLKCGQFVGMQNAHVSYIGRGDGRVFTTGVVRCKNPECPVCAGQLISKKVKVLKKALTEYKMQGGDFAFITITMRPTRDPVKGIRAMKDLKKRIDKLIRNASRTMDECEKPLSYITMEKTFSSKWAKHDELGRECAPFAYLHTHLHLVLGTFESHLLHRLIEKIRTLCKETLSLSNGLYSHISQDLDEVSHGFDVDYRDHTENLAEYLNKHLSSSSKLALEVGQERSKTGSGMGLDVLLSEMHRDPRKPLNMAHIVNIRAWFREMFGFSRSKGIGIAYWASQFEKRQERMIKDWLKRNSIDNPDWRAAYSITSMEYADMDQVWLDDELAPVHITREMKEKSLLAFREDVDVRLYNFFRYGGLESTLEHLFSVYWYDELYEECYQEYQKVNFRYSDEGAVKLRTLLATRGLLRGTRANTYPRL